MKLKIVRFILVFVFLLIIVFGAISFKAPTFGLLDCIFNSEQKEIIELSNKTSKNIGVIIKADSEEELENIKNEFFKILPSINLDEEKIDFDFLIENFISHPSNYLSYQTREAIKHKEYETIMQKSYELLYNPTSLYIAPLNTDPYLFVTDYVLNLYNPNIDTKEKDGKYYYKINLESKNNKAKIDKLIEFQKLNKGKIYYTGNLIHTYTTSKNSALEINIICIVSTILILLLCAKYFNTIKVIVPIMLSILIGILTGFFVTILVFKNIHILTVVFATSIIGVSLDYSLHYIKSKKDETLMKNLTASVFTTSCAFLVLLFFSSPLLKQIGVFTSFGLIGVYFFVVFFFPLFKNFYETKNNSFKYPKIAKYKLGILSLILILAAIGLFRFNLTSDIKDFYKPRGELLKGEKINAEIFKLPPAVFITVGGKNLEEILQKEEKITDFLYQKNIKYVSLSTFLPSSKRQLENFNLIKELYAKNLDKYAFFLNEKENLKKLNFKNVTIEKEFMEKFMLNQNTSFIVVFDKDVEFKNKIDLRKDISSAVKEIQNKCLVAIPLVFIIYFVLLSVCFSPKKAFKIILSPLCASIFSILIISNFNDNINMFHILSLFLILGFSLDYSIFTINGSKSSKDAVFISFLSSFISFTLLSLTSFKLISSIGTVLALGLLISYILNLLFFEKEEN